MKFCENCILFLQSAEIRKCVVCRICDVFSCDKHPIFCSKMSFTFRFLENRKQQCLGHALGQNKFYPRLHFAHSFGYPHNMPRKNSKFLANADQKCMFCQVGRCFIIAYGKIFDNPLTILSSALPTAF